MGISIELLFILFIIFLELIQIIVSKKKIAKWVIPILSFAILMPLNIKAIIEYHDDFFVDVILESLYIELPTIIYLMTNWIMKKRNLTERNF